MTNHVQFSLTKEQLLDIVTFGVQFEPFNKWGFPQAVDVTQKEDGSFALTVTHPSIEGSVAAPAQVEVGLAVRSFTQKLDRDRPEEFDADFPVCINKPVVRIKEKA